MGKPTGRFMQSKSEKWIKCWDKWLKSYKNTTFVLSAFVRTEDKTKTIGKTIDSIGELDWGTPPLSGHK